MAEPTSVYTLEDLLLRVAEEAGVAYYGASGQEKAHIPIDVYDLDKCLRVVNDGIKMFIGDAPPEGWRWRRRLMEVTFVPSISGVATAGTATSLTCGALAGTYADNYFNGYLIRIISGTGIGQTATITDYTSLTGKFDFSGELSGGSTPDTTTGFQICPSASVINADPARYLLSEDFGSYAGQITYKEDSNRGGIIEWTNETTIRQNRETVVVTGYPHLAAVRAYGTRRYELIVDPSPTAADTVVFPYNVGPDNLTVIVGTATAGSAISLTCGAIAGSYANDYFKNWTMKIISGIGVEGTATVTGYVGATGVFSVVLSNGTTPTTTSIFYVEPANNKHPAGLEFDFAILSACLAQTELQFKIANVAYMEKYYKQDLPQAYKLNNRFAPTRLGIIGSGRGRTKERTWKNVTYN